ncbi:MAG: hypothetical protein LBP28_00175 [Coriobacteriales bacterium]|jgi:hypothetical protein|nr:hypothetical protein [Coriobacteriales bacterium]
MTRATGFLIAVLTATASFVNYAWHLSGSSIHVFSVTIQVVLVLLSAIAALLYRNKRIRPGYELGLIRVFTYSFGAIVLALIANVSILVAILMQEV